MAQFLIDDILPAQAPAPQPQPMGALQPWQQIFMRYTGRHPLEFGVRTQEDALRYFQRIRTPTLTPGVRG